MHAYTIVDHTDTQKSQDVTQNVRQFMLAGNATITVVNEQTGNRFTFKVRQPAKGKPHFVQVLTGPDNTSDYTFLGTIFNAQDYRHGKRSSISQNAPSAKVFGWFWSHLDNLPAQVHVYHEGRCGRCGRKLTVPESIQSGFGPECAGLI